MPSAAKKIRLEWYEKKITACQNTMRQHGERRRAIEQDIVVLRKIGRILNPPQEILDEKFPLFGIHIYILIYIFSISSQYNPTTAGTKW